MRACLVSVPAVGLDNGAGERLREPALAVVRAERAVAFGRDLGLVMGSSKVCATLSVALPQPYLGKMPAGQAPEAVRRGAQVTHSNAPFLLESQSILSKIVASKPALPAIRKVPQVRSCEQANGILIGAPKVLAIV